MDFAGDAFWRELDEMHREGKLDAKMERLYFSPTRPMFELFDLEADPSEFNNLAGTPGAAEVEKELKAAMQEWMILQRDFVPLPVGPEARAPKKPGAKPGGKRNRGAKAGVQADEGIGQSRRPTTRS